MLSACSVVGMKLFGSFDMTGNPLLLLAVFSMMLSIQFLSLGLLGEVCARIYFGSLGKEHYTVRELVNFQPDDAPISQQKRAA